MTSSFLCGKPTVCTSMYYVKYVLVKSLESTLKQKPRMEIIPSKIHENSARLKKRDSKKALQVNLGQPIPASEWVGIGKHPISSNINPI